MKIPNFQGDRDQRDKAIVHWLDDLKKDGDSAKQQYVNLWSVCERFLRGKGIDRIYLHQINEVFNIDEFIEDIELFGYSHTSNNILPLLRQASSVISANFSSIIAKPASTDQEDIQTAALATDFLANRNEQDKESLVRYNELVTVMTYGECMRYTRYNPRLVSPDGVQGDIETIVLDPSQYCKCPHDTDTAHPSWVIMSEVCDVEEVEALYPDKKVKSQDITVTRYGNMNRDRNSISRSDKKCVVNRLYIRENADNPKGRYFAWTGDVLLQANDTLPDGIFPFVAFQWFTHPCSYYPIGFIEPCIKPQIIINLTITKMNILSRKIVNPEMVVQGDENIYTEVLENGQRVIRIDDYRNQPTFLKYPNDISIAVQMKQEAEYQLLDLTGVREISMGRQPVVATATTTAMLKESDNTGLYSFKERLDTSFADVCKIKLFLAQKYFKEKRIIAVTGKANEQNLAYFYGADLKGNYDVIPTKTPFVSPATEQQIRFNLMQMGVYNPVEGSEHLFANMTAILNSGLPQADDIVRQILGGELSYEQLAEIVQSVRNDKMQLEIQNLDLTALQQEAQSQQIAAQMQQMQMQQQMQAQQAMAPEGAMPAEEGAMAPEQGMPQEQIPQETEVM